MKEWKRYLLYCVVITLQFQVLCSQINLDNPPKENAFIPRDIVSNMGSIIVKGRVTDTAVHSLLIQVYKDGILKDSTHYAINVVQNQGEFNQKIELISGKFFYSIKFVLKGTGVTYSKTIDGIMVGDVYLIQGQSNAMAGNYSNINHTKAYSDTFIKTFGNTYPYPTVASDTFWYSADGEKYYYTACVGQWGLVMAKTLLDSFGIPICLINGAVGATIITQHLSSPGNPEDMLSVYGRLLYRVKKAGVQNHIRGIFFFQGESDGSNAQLHDTMFRKVYTSWNKDYKGFHKLYVVQVRGKGCVSPSIELREYQRQFEFALPKCKVISTNGLNSHDGCHFRFKDGYELLGQQLAALASRDLYQAKNTENIDPPNIRNCYYSHADQNEITANMYNPSDIIYADSNFHKLFRVEGDGSVFITRGFIRNNRIVLQLNKSSCKLTGLTYDSDTGKQPWVKNILHMGLISCHKVPILKHQIQPSYSGCKQTMIVLGEDSIAGNQYLWKRPDNLKTHTTSKIKIRGDSIEKLTLIISYGPNTCKNRDTIMVYLLPDPVIIPELGNDTTICLGDSAFFQPNAKGFEKFKWKRGLQDSSDNLIFKIINPGKIELLAVSKNHCIYNDSVFISISIPSVSLPKNIHICKDSDTLMEVSDSFITYKWNNMNGVNRFRTKVGKLKLEVRDIYGCVAVDSVDITMFPQVPKPMLNFNICRNENRMIAKPDGFYSWYQDSSKLNDSFKVYPDHIYPILLMDSNRCLVNDTLRTLGYSIPAFSLGKDSSFCKNAHINIQLPENMYEYFLNKTRLTTNHVKIHTSGTFIASITDSNNCHYRDTLRVSEYGLPQLNNFHDTTLCLGSKWYPSLDDQITYTVNSIRITKNYYFDQSGFYHIVATNQYSCQSHSDILISIKDCNITVPELIQPIVLLYPNPFINTLHISFGTLSSYIIIHNCVGKQVFGCSLNPGLNTLDLSSLSSGIYQIEAGGQHIMLIKD